MSRHGRPQVQPARASAPSGPPAPAVAPPSAPGVPPTDASAVDAGPAPLPPPAAPAAAPRFIARVRIHAGATYEPGDEIPAHVAADGFVEGVEYRRET